MNLTLNQFKQLPFLFDYEFDIETVKGVGWIRHDDIKCDYFIVTYNNELYRMEAICYISVKYFPRYKQVSQEIEYTFFGKKTKPIYEGAYMLSLGMEYREIFEYEKVANKRKEQFEKLFEECKKQRIILV